MSFRISEGEIRRRFVRLRNLERLHAAVKARVVTLAMSLKAERQKTHNLTTLLAEKEARIARLEEELRDKEAQRQELLRMAYKANRPSGERQKPGKKPGTPAFHRPLPREDEITERRTFSLSRCPVCRHPVGPAVDTAVKYEEDIDLAPRKLVKAYTITRHWCAHCEMFMKSARVPVVSRIGLNVLGYILYARYRLRLPLNKIQESLLDLHDFRLSEGEIVAQLKEAESLFGKDFQAITELVKTARVVHADETGWRMDGKNWWLWVFVTEQGIRYVLEESRGGGVPREALGDKQDRVIISDGYAVYTKLQGDQQQCWVHLLRKAGEVSPSLHTDLTTLYLELGRELTKPVKERDPPRFMQRLHAIIRKRYEDPLAVKVQARIQRHRDQLLTCLRYQGVLPENNTAERALRSQVVMRKIFGGSRSVAGARAHEVNSSVIETKLRERPQASFLEVILPLLEKRRSEL